MGGFSQKVNLKPAADAKAEVRGLGGRPQRPQNCIWERWGAAGAAAGPAQPGTSWGQLGAACAAAAAHCRSPLPLSMLQGRTGVLTRRAAAQLAAAGTGNAQVRRRG